MLSNALSVYLSCKYSIKKSLIKEGCSGLSRQQLNRVCEYIKVHLEENIRLDDLAKVAQIGSPHYFCRLFKKTTGLTPYQYLIQQRMELGKQLLQQIDLPIIQIALSCGFSSQSSFTTAFRKYTGVTPRVYRLQL